MSMIIKIEISNTVQSRSDLAWCFANPSNKPRFMQHTSHLNGKMIGKHFNKDMSEFREVYIYCAKLYTGMKRLKHK